LAIRSQHTWGEAKKNGVFDLEMANVEITTKKGTKVCFVTALFFVGVPVSCEFDIYTYQVIDTDEHPRPDTSLEKISALRPVFKKDGVVTAANASGICDGAGSIILASEEAVKEHGLKPLARLAGYNVHGCEPEIMGIG
jgi:acetyl-CoA acyltransferase 2